MRPILNFPLLLLFASVSLDGSPAWSQAMDCHYIDCDCANVGGPFPRIYMEECREWESKIKEECSKGKPAAQQFCHSTASGPDAWPDDDKPRPSPEKRGEKILTDMCQGLQRGDEEQAYQQALDSIAPLDNELPGVAMIARIGSSRIANRRALKNMDDSLFFMAGGVDKDVAQVVLPPALRALEEAQRNGAVTIEEQLRLNRQMEKLINQGLAVKELAGDDAKVIKYLEYLQKIHKAGWNTEKVRETNDTNSKQFISSFVSLIPKNLSPAVTGPMMTVAEAQVRWTKSLYEASADAMDLVGKAIETGNFDTAAYSKISSRIENLGRTGPWNGKSLGAAVKKWSEDIPVIGKLVKAFVTDPALENGELGSPCPE